MIIHTDLYDIYGTFIAKKGEKLTKRLLTKIANIPTKKSSIHLLRNSFIYRDMLKASRDPKYNTMLGSEKEKKRILSSISMVLLENGVLKELANMKKILPYTYYHELIVCLLTIKISNFLNIKKLDIKIAAYGAMTHDLGKTRIPKYILKKKTPLTIPEYELLRTHPTLGYLLLSHYAKKTKNNKAILSSYQHHEKLDASGYPNNLKRIDIYAQIVSVADILDALLAKRPYRKKQFKLRSALDYLLDEANDGKISKKIVFTLISLSRKTKPDLKHLVVSKTKRLKPPSDNIYGSIQSKDAHHLI